jgi:hypothetical protein
MSQSHFYRIFDAFNVEEIDKSFSLFRKWEWLSILLNVIIVFLRIVATSIVIYIGFFFLEERILFKKIFSSVIICELIFIFQMIVRIIYFAFISPPININEFKIMPLSVLSLFSYEKIDEWMYYVLNTLNIFELIYFVVLCFLISKSQYNSFKKTVSTIFYSYGIGLFLFMILISFMQLYRI